MNELVHFIAFNSGVKIQNKYKKNSLLPSLLLQYSNKKVTSNLLNLKFWRNNQIWYIQTPDRQKITVHFPLHLRFQFHNELSTNSWSNHLFLCVSLFFVFFFFFGSWIWSKLLNVSFRSSVLILILIPESN